MNARADISDPAVVFARSATTSSKASRASYGFGSALAFISRWMRSGSRALLAGRASRRLSVSETVSLGEKRFVSILCVDGEQFLVGGSSSNVVLLAKLDKSDAAGSDRTSEGEFFSQMISRAAGDEKRSVSPIDMDRGSGV